MKHITTTCTCDICGAEMSHNFGKSASARVVPPAARAMSPGNAHYAVVEVIASGVTFYRSADYSKLHSVIIEDICPRCLRSALEGGAKWLTGLIGDEKGD